MRDLHPRILERDGEKVFVVLPYEEFVQLEEELRDFDDLKALRAAKAQEADAPTVSLDEARKQFDL